MPNILEILSSGAPVTEMQQALQDGASVLDNNSDYTFTAYSKVILPADGYVFWSPNIPFTVNGSLHYLQSVVQDADAIYGGGNILFTTQQRIKEFETPSDRIFVIKMDNYVAGFSQQQGFYTAAGMWHYFGNIIPTPLLTQFLDEPLAIDTTQPVANNSLPLWLALNTYSSPFGGEGFSMNTIIGYAGKALKIFPAYLATPNYAPPFATVDITYTRALQAAPLLDKQRNHSQLCQDSVDITIYGLQNNAAMDFVDMVNEFTLATDYFGLMNMPVMRDEKRPQPEIATIGMQKKITYEISYYQTRAIQVSRKLILDALPIKFGFNPFP